MGFALLGAVRLSGAKFSHLATLAGFFRFPRKSTAHLLRNQLELLMLPVLSSLYEQLNLLARLVCGRRRRGGDTVHVLTSFSSHRAKRSLRRRSIRIWRRASDASLLNFSRNISRMTFQARFCSRSRSTKASSSSACGSRRPRPGARGR